MNRPDFLVVLPFLIGVGCIISMIPSVRHTSHSSRHLEDYPMGMDVLQQLESTEGRRWMQAVPR